MTSASRDPAQSGKISSRDDASHDDISPIRFADPDTLEALGADILETYAQAFAELKDK